MGREAAYTGKVVTWDEILNSQESLMPENLDLKAADADAAGANAGTEDELSRLQSARRPSSHEFERTGTRRAGPEPAPSQEEEAV